VQQRLVRIERSTGVGEIHSSPRHTRRRPLGSGSLASGRR
jgi:hypothetical protein